MITCIAVTELNPMIHSFLRFVSICFEIKSFHFMCYACVQSGQ